MTIQHHPPEQLLFNFAAGRLDQGERLAVMAHVSTCASCRRLTGALDVVGGMALEEVRPAAMAANAFEVVCSRIDAEDRIKREPKPMARPHGDMPAFLRSYPMGNWKWVAPGVSLRPILLDKDSRTRAFLLKSAPGTRMLQHSHSGTEMTCVLSGSFTHERGYFGPGDFDFGDGSIDHQPVVGDGMDCVCLVAMTGKLKLNGLLGKAIQPFIRI